MMSAKMSELAIAETEKVWQMKTVGSKILSLYSDLSMDAMILSHRMPTNTTSDNMKKAWLNQYIDSLNNEIADLRKEIYGITQSAMASTAQAVVDANNEFMKRAGLDIKGAFNYIPTDVVANLLNGSVYEGNWTFSKAIWGATEKTSQDLQDIVAKGIASQKPILDIAKDLEKYVDPSAKKDWEWSKVYPGTSTKVDYNAQRLARTLVQHAYQQSLRETIRYNPFVTGVVWHSVFSKGRTCALCEERDGTFYEKGKEPLDHPNGLCYLTPEIPKSMNEIADELADWANGKPNPDIDRYVAKSFGFSPTEKLGHEVIEKQMAEAKAAEDAKNDRLNRPDFESTKEDVDKYLSFIKNSFIEAYGDDWKHLEPHFVGLNGNQFKLLRLINNFSDGIGIDPYDSHQTYYDQKLNKVFFSPQLIMTPMSTNQHGAYAFFHEHGHMLDMLSGLSMNTKTSIHNDFAENFNASLKAEAKKLLVDPEAEHKRVKPEVKKDFEDFFYESAGIQDIVNGLCNGDVDTYWMHDADYWSRNKTNFDSEAFAEMTAAYFGDNQRAMMEKYFPKSFDLFKKQMDELVNGDYMETYKPFTLEQINKRGR